MLMINLLFLNNLLGYYKMPKYAVAVGRKVGIYDTYDECKEQVMNFPKARFKKFNTTVEAEEFIAKFSTVVNQPSISDVPKAVPSTSRPNVASSKKLVHSAPIMKVEKVSPSDPVLHNLFQTVNNLNDKLDKFISATTGMLQNLQERLEYIENNAVIRSDVDVSPPAKVPRLETKTDFKKTDTGAVIVFTDGACSNNGQFGAKAGIGVWFNHGHPLNVSAPAQCPATNNNAEIQAARIAIQQAHSAGVRRLSIHTDSKFVISCINDWMQKWKANGWQLSTGGPVKNRYEIEKLDKAIEKMESVQWVYVTAHCGVEGNEMADKLAREGAAQYKGYDGPKSEDDADDEVID